MRHLVIICHPKEHSFTRAAAGSYIDAVKALGHDVAVRDLYHSGFDPVLTAGELPSARRPIVPAEVRREQRYVADSGALAFFHPLWWAFMPAMLKGYFDRVFAHGFAYDFDGDDIVPLLSGRKALIFTTSGASRADLRRARQWHAMRVLEDDNLLSRCGIELLDHLLLPSIRPGMTSGEAEKHFAEVRSAVEKHWSTQPVPAG